MGYVVAELCSQDQCKFHFATIAWIPHGIVVDTLMCGWVNTKAAPSQSRL